MNQEVPGVRAIDIHAHFFPQTYLDVLAQEGPRFNVEYRAAEEGFYIKTEVRFQGPLYRRCHSPAQWRIGAMKRYLTNCPVPGTMGPVPHMCSIRLACSDS